MKINWEGMESNIWTSANRTYLHESMTQIVRNSRDGVLKMWHQIDNAWFIVKFSCKQQPLYQGYNNKIFRYHRIDIYSPYASTRTRTCNKRTVNLFVRSQRLLNKWMDFNITVLRLNKQLRKLYKLVRLFTFYIACIMFHFIRAWGN